MPSMHTKKPAFPIRFSLFLHWSICTINLCLCTILDLRQKRTDEIVNHEPMTLAQVDQLSLHICRYVLPLNQAKSKRHALIFYSEENRKCAISEANNMRESLRYISWYSTI